MSPKNGWKNEVCGALGGGLGTSWGGGDVSTGPVVGVGGVTCAAIIIFGMTK